MNKRVVGILLDETGSMRGQEKRVTTGINEYMNTLVSKANGKATSYQVVLNLFDSERWHEYYQGPLDEFPMMSDKDYEPGAMTPLYDSIYKMIKNIERDNEDAKVLMLIDTDGLENASQEINQQQVFSYIKQKEDEGWTFVFLGAEMEEFGGADKVQKSMGLGIAKGNTLDVVHENRRAVYNRAANATSSYMNDKSKSSDQNFWDRA
jgi:hypothetical protein